MDQIIRPQTGKRAMSPADLRAAVQLKETAVILGIVTGTIVVLSLIALFLNWTKNNQITSFERTIAAKEQAIEANFGRTVKQQALIKKQLETLAQTEDKQIDYRRQLWEELAKRAVKRVRLVSLALTDNKITIEGQADSYSDIARQIISWKQSNNFSNVKLQSASGSKEGKREFSANLEFNKTSHGQSQ